MMCDEFQDDDNVRTNSAAWGELRDSAIFDPSLRPTMAELTERWIDDIATLVANGPADGSLGTAADPRIVGAQLTALAEGLSSRWLADLITTERARQLIAAAIDAFASTS